MRKILPVLLLAVFWAAVWYGEWRPAASLAGYWLWSIAERDWLRASADLHNTRRVEHSNR